MIGLFVSRTAQAGFVQVTHVGPADDDGPIMAAAAPVAAPPVAIGPAVLTVQEQLQNNGRAVLADLTFETGSAQLAAQAFASLRDLAEYLAGNPTQTVVLVGHTDTDGDLAPNIALSKRRAASVVERLVTNYGTPRRQLVAEGIGFLAPLASNATAAGRDSNRRVEAVLAGDGN
jgi:OOP family OmpA-OmpF porin